MYPPTRHLVVNSKFCHCSLLLWLLLSFYDGSRLWKRAGGRDEGADMLRRASGTCFGMRSGTNTYITHIIVFRCIYCLWYNPWNALTLIPLLRSVSPSRVQCHPMFLWETPRKCLLKSPFFAPPRASLTTHHVTRNKNKSLEVFPWEIKARLDLGKRFSHNLVKYRRILCVLESDLEKIRPR